MNIIYVGKVIKQEFPNAIMPIMTFFSLNQHGSFFCSVTLSVTDHVELLVPGNPSLIEELSENYSCCVTKSSFMIFFKGEYSYLHLCGQLITTF